MVINEKEMLTEIVEKAHDGSGITEIKHLIPPDKMPANASMFSIATLQAWSSIGVHTHLTESEVYYILSGKGVIDDDGRRIPIKAGDCHMCCKGSEHGIVNDNDEPLVFLVVIIEETNELF